MSSCCGLVLVVEDDSDLREALCDYLGSLGCRVAGASDGVEGLLALRTGALPCLVLVDVDMPRLDGRGFVQEVRSRGEFDGLPIISMSAGAGGLEKHGAARHLRKPFAEGSLDALVKQWCPIPRGGAESRAGTG